MLGYISSTRKKSCRQCVKAKRRCDLGFPCCRRCFAKGLACAYPNASVREAEVIIRQTTPDLAPLHGPAEEVGFGLGPSGPGELPEQEHVGAIIDPALLQSWEVQQPTPSIRRELLPDIWAPSYLNEDQVCFLIDRLCSLVPSLVFSGHNAFIHQSLYAKQQPSAYEDSCALSALYLAKTPQNAPVITRSIENKIKGLVAARRTWSLTEHLAAVQAMIIYQAIRLFDPELEVQATAAGQNRFLEAWTAALWRRSFREPATFPSAWDAWVFYESLRRTVLISVFLRGGWSCINRGGLCDQIPVLAKLPLERYDVLWGVSDEGEFEMRRGMGKEAKESLVAYGEWAAEWRGGRDDVGGLTEWQRMLLAACRGKDDPRLLPRGGGGGLSGFTAC
ncbi:hypothetical protein K458DRAFT_309863 [Lentithecium fluviatile CBS 122367]|uniref:Zn(2)-C6 fungal-type domain-containing protein n=1 Tax=Lentithecium fluviatile CBS 122367 TaxID=1168545 RepID=A0A6G1ITL2_9PLEO|nr:hypothetical protein K458DRAFT_309863 [Lentithecium fluviatile CBS 122367]